MVFFTCNHCGESVKKPAVEKHYNTRCRGAVKDVSCMDCLKDFRHEEYVAHIKCISEKEKYSGKDYVHKESKNSGAKKQESWMDIVRSILESSEYKLSSQARNAFQRLQSYDNVPRKKAKFQNFIANCMKMPKAQAAEVWNILEKELEKMKQAKQQEVAARFENKNQNQDVTIAEAAAPLETNKPDEPAKKKVKRKNSNENEVDSSPVNGHDEPKQKKLKKNKTAEESKEIVEATSNGAEQADETESEFQWIVVLEKLVTKHSEGILLEKLKKKILKKYLSKLGIDSLTEKQQKKIRKKTAEKSEKVAGNTNGCRFSEALLNCIYFKQT